MHWKHLASCSGGRSSRYSCKQLHWLDVISVDAQLLMLVSLWLTVRRRRVATSSARYTIQYVSTHNARRQRPRHSSALSTAVVAAVVVVSLRRRRVRRSMSSRRRRRRRRSAWRGAQSRWPDIRGSRATAEAAAGQAAPAVTGTRWTSTNDVCTAAARRRGRVVWRSLISTGRTLPSTNTSARSRRWPVTEARAVRASFTPATIRYTTRRSRQPALSSDPTTALTLQARRSGSDVTVVAARHSRQRRTTRVAAATRTAAAVTTRRPERQAPAPSNEWLSGYRRALISRRKTQTASDLNRLTRNSVHRLSTYVEHGLAVIPCSLQRVWSIFWWQIYYCRL